MTTNVLDPLMPLNVTGTEKTPPNPKRTKDAFGRIGYTLSEAIADLLDNSIDAKARRVLVRFVYDRDEVRAVYIADDGHGMSPSTLSEAMQFGSHLKHSDGDLGKYGMGLKSASFSQCKTLTVLTRKSGEVSGRRWVDKEIDKDWLCEILSTSDCQRILDSDWAPLSLKHSGTIVIWNQLTGLHSSQTNPLETINREIAVLSNQLGLTFHRFLESGALEIHLGSISIGARGNAITQMVLPLNPFGYPASGDAAYPQKVDIPTDTGASIELHCHIWPAKSRLPEYKLGGGKVSSRQGFYFYRNNRLVQAGGWNGLRDDDSEPHLSLARVAVDIPPQIQVSVQKAHVIDLPKGFIKNARHATSKYIKAADNAYRRGKPSEPSMPLVLGKGFTAELRQVAKSRLVNDETKVLAVDFTWKKLKPSNVFEIDGDNGVVHLNSLYRKSIVGKSESTPNDAQSLKLCLFFILREFVSKTRLSRSDKQRIELVNDLLLRDLNAE